MTARRRSIFDCCALVPSSVPFFFLPGWGERQPDRQIGMKFCPRADVLRRSRAGGPRGPEARQPDPEAGCRRALARRVAPDPLLFRGKSSRHAPQARPKGAPSGARPSVPPGLRAPGLRAAGLWARPVARSGMRGFLASPTGRLVGPLMSRRIRLLQAYRHSPALRWHVFSDAAKITT